MRGWLLSVDPGRCTGAALWLDGTLYAARVVEAEGSVTTNPDARHGVARAVDRWVQNMLANEPGRTPPIIYVHEWPEVFRNDRTTAKDLNDFFPLYGIADSIAVLLPPFSTTLQLSQVEWKKQLDKSVTRARCWERLTPAERARVPDLPDSKAHNMYDAVGIGLHVLGRGILNARRRVVAR